MPSLGEFRRQFDLSEIPRNSVEVVQQKLRIRELPGTICAGCGNHYAGLLPFVVHCEESFLASSRFGSSRKFFKGLSLLLGLLMLLDRDYGPQESKRLLGRDVFIDTPLRLCDACQQVHGNKSTLLWMWPMVVGGTLIWPAWRATPDLTRQLFSVLLIVGAVVWMIATLAAVSQQDLWKSWLRLVPEYGQLLREFPAARIELTKDASDATSGEAAG